MVRLFRVFIPASVIALVVVDALLLAAAYVAVSYLIFDFDPQLFYLYDIGWALLAENVLVLLIGFSFNRLYDVARPVPAIVLLQSVAVAFGVAFLFQAAQGYLDPEFILPRGLMLYGSAAAFAVVTAWRLFAASGMRTFGGERVVFVGCGQLAREIASRLERHPELGLAPAGYVAAEPAAVDANPLPFLGRVAELPDIAATLKPGRISVCEEERDDREAMRTLLDMRIVGAPVEHISDVYEAVFGRVSATNIRPEDVLLTRSFQPARGAIHLQAAYSFLAALIALVLTAPLMLAIAVLVRLSFPGSVLVRTRCAGLDGKPFTMLRFRSRHDFREAVHPNMAEHTGVAPLGRVLLRTGLDALPALVNVLRGDMSIVGPRPEQVEYADELARLIPYYPQRYAVKPGLIGWAQLRGRRPNSIELTVRKLEYDLFYIKNVSASLDLYIGINTFWNVLLGWPT